MYIILMSLKFFATLPARGSRALAYHRLAGAHASMVRHGLRNPGNGEYRVELRRAVTTIQSYLNAHQHPKERALLRLDGQYGTGAVLSDLAGLLYVMRGKNYQILKRASDPGSLALAIRSAPHPSRKRDRAGTLRLSGPGSRSNAGAVPGRGRHTSGSARQESGGSDSRWSSLRIVLHDAASERLHGQ